MHTTSRLTCQLSQEPYVRSHVSGLWTCCIPGVNHTHTKADTDVDARELMRNKRFRHILPAVTECPCIRRNGPAAKGMQTRAPGPSWGPLSSIRAEQHQTRPTEKLSQPICRGFTRHSRSARSIFCPSCRMESPQKLQPARTT